MPNSWLAAGCRSWKDCRRGASQWRANAGCVFTISGFGCGSGPATDADGNRLQLHTVSPPLNPRAGVFQEDNPDFVTGYINDFVINGAVIAPGFGDAEADGKA